MTKAIKQQNITLPCLSIAFLSRIIDVTEKQKHISKLEVNT